METSDKDRASVAAAREAYTPAVDDVVYGMGKVSQTYGRLKAILENRVPGFGWRGGPEGLYTLSPVILQDVANRVERDKERYRLFHGSHNPEAEKVGGFFVYWIAKRRPIVYMDWKGDPLTPDEYFLNEYLAIFTGLNRVVSSYLAMAGADERTNRIKAIRDVNSPRVRLVLRDWRYTLAYRNFSSDDMMLMLKLCIS